MNTFVYLCRDGENEELRYSIRSVIKFYPDARIILVGGKPDWYVGEFIPCPQNTLLFENISRSVSTIANHPSIPENFVMMNDDFFLRQKVDEFVHHISGPLQEKIDFHKSNGMAGSGYVRKLEALNKYIVKDLGIYPALDFELHTPMPVEKSKLAEMGAPKVMWRSEYGNRYVKHATTTPDIKFYDSSIMAFKSVSIDDERLPFFSTDDSSFKAVFPKIHSMFPDASYCES